jgi:protein involved in polysaccharide export with SLBB domain
VQQQSVALRISRYTAALFVTVAGLVLTAGAAYAQSSGSPDLLSIFNNMSPDQQQAIMQQMGGMGSGGGAAGNLSRTGKKSDLTGDQYQRWLKNQSDLMQPHKLQADDLIFVEVEIERQKLVYPTPAVPGGASASAAGATTGSVQSDQGTALAAGAQNMTVPPSATTPGSPSASPILAPPIEVDDKEKARLQKLITLIRSKDPYTLDPAGAVLLPGFAAITLAGLTEEQAALRLSAEPDLLHLDFKVTYLPVKRLGGVGLKHYGYDLFGDITPSTYAPTSDVPVPGNYIVGPGDQFSVQLYGSQNRTIRLTVGRDGLVSFPELGPIGVVGRSFAAVTADIESRVARQMIGVRASVSMGETRAIQVFVLGESRFPGAYTISGLSTMTSALFASGGVTEIGSLRKIQLKRGTKTISELDLYDLLMRGDASHDAQLQAGDVVFIPSIGSTVAIDGEVQRPAIYELKDAVTVSAGVQMAGGFTSAADTGKATLSRVDAQRRRVVQDIDPTNSSAGAELLRNADVLRIARLRPTLDSGVTLDGEVYRPGSYAWHANMRLSQLLTSLDELKPDADQHYVLIRREDPVTNRISVISADLPAALAAPGSAADLELQPRDRLTVFDLQHGRERVIQPLMDELQMQSNQQQSQAIVNISGGVKAPGDYPLETGMRVSDLIRAGGSLDTAAYSGSAELSRYVVENGQSRRTQVLEIDLPQVLRGDPQANLALQPFDRLYIKEVAGWSDHAEVKILGEVRFPGTYPIKRGETLRSVLKRAGGLTDQAFPEGAVFTREDLKEREQQQLNRLADRMQNELTATTMMQTRGGQGGSAEAYTIGQSLLSQLKAAKAVGRLVIDIEAAKTAPEDSGGDVIMRDGDQLLVPKRSQEVTVIGEVQNATSHLFRGDLSRDDYIALSGGVTRLADSSKIYVVHANGSVATETDHWWVPHVSSTVIRPGDTIVVPLDAERVPALPTWLSVTQILYQIAIAVAAIHSFQ